MEFACFNILICIKNLFASFYHGCCAPTEERVRLKLLVNKETNKVLFAEAGKDLSMIDLVS